MKSNRIRRSVLPLGLAGVMAVAIATGAGFSSSAVVAKPAPDKVAAEARKALASGQVEKAIAMAEELVAANPKEAGYRAILGQAYLRAGRFESAAQSLDDAMKLGDNSARTALSLSLAYSGMGKNREAVAILDDWRDAIPVADLGLAYALAGESSRGVAILSDALRGGENTPKLRQNLAYAFALDGRWREARLMAAQDVPADKLDARISSWASRSRPEDGRVRVAGLLGAPVRADQGMPAQLALNASPDQEQLAAETGAQRAPAPTFAANGELPAANANPTELAQYQPVSAPVAEAAPAEPVPARSFAATFSETPVVQPIPASLPDRSVAPKAKKPARAVAAQVAVAPAAPAAHRPGLRPRRAAAPVIGKGSSHAVQLGSFSSEQGARRAWGYYAARNAELRNFRMNITPATVRGKKFWRVAAVGLDGNGAGGLCSKVKSRGGVCFAYATTGRAANAPAYAAKAKPKAPAMAAAKPKAAPAGPSNARKK
ncbi:MULTISPECIES: tetratricopeptide repeat protein [unclassified Novosphingobium]|uniref:tetratricopeptide repeat protein n=1 Tax=unclassified Novosphingobium TaxID=2644732 RepID=UPI0025F76CDA|nr:MULTISPECIES: tetratricopeptide repeat protein [unclassified Novosphingobium]HQV03112.1 CDC27 family protein [Novosphingobium sp.]